MLTIGGKRLIGKEIFDKLLPWAFYFKSPRSKAFTLMGLKYYQKAYPEDPNLKKNIREFAEKLLGHYKAEHALKRTVQLYPDLKEVKLFNIYRYYYHNSLAEEDRWGNVRAAGC